MGHFCMLDGSWKAAYVENYDIERNWQTTTTSASWSVHNNHVITCLHLYDNKVICGSDDCSISIWDLDHLIKKKVITSSSERWENQTLSKFYYSWKVIRKGLEFLLCILTFLSLFLVHPGYNQRQRND